MLDSNALIIFVKVAEIGSFSGVSRELGLAKSVISQKISVLEENLKVRLFHRTTRKVSLTDEGLQLLPMARNLTDSVQDIIDYSESFTSEPSGKLRITMPHDLGNLIIRKVIPRYRKEFPKVQIEFFYSNQFLDLIQEQIDLAIRVSVKSFDDSSYISKKLFRSELGLYARPDFQGLDQLSDKKDLIKYPMVQRTAAEFVEFDGKGVNEKVATGKPVMICNDMQGLVTAAKAGIGIALLPQFLASEPVAAGDLVEVLDDLKIVSATFHILYPSRRLLPQKTRAFIEMLQELFD